MNGGHYICGKRAIPLIAEEITQLLFIELLNKKLFIQVQRIVQKYRRHDGAL